MKQPAWIDKPPSEWPPEARLAFDILALGAERVLKDEAEAKARKQTAGTAGVA